MAEQVNFENKIAKMEKFLAENNIKCFEVEKFEDEVHTTVFRSHMEVQRQVLPMAILIDDSIYVLLQVQIAPQILDKDKLAALSSEINNMNNNVRLFKFTVSDNGDFMLNACITTENSCFNPELLIALIAQTLSFLEAQYTNIMKLLWRDK